MKICTTCKLPKSPDEFGPYKRYADGKDRICRVCRRLLAAKLRLSRGQVPMQPFLTRLWENIQQCGHEDLCPYCCWPWLKQRDKDSHGIISIAYNGRNQGYRVARIVWELWHGRPLVDTLLACHFCDNPPCCNPAHIWPGTHQQNHRDAMAKGRDARGLNSGVNTKPEAFPRGERHHKAKLTEQDVRDIREAHRQGRSAYYLQNLYPVSKPTIQAILDYVTWKDVK